MSEHVWNKSYKQTRESNINKNITHNAVSVYVSVWECNPALPIMQLDSQPVHSDIWVRQFPFKADLPGNESWFDVVQEIE